MSKRVDQFRSEFQTWIDNRIESLTLQWDDEMKRKHHLAAMKTAIQLDELELVKSTVIPMTR